MVDQVTPLRKDLHTILFISPNLPYSSLPNEGMQYGDKDRSTQHALGSDRIQVLLLNDLCIRLRDSGRSLKS